MSKNSNLETIRLGVEGYVYADLYRPDRLRALYSDFNRRLESSDPALLKAFTAYQACQGKDMRAQDISKLLVAMAPHVGQFIAHLFTIDKQRQQQIQAIMEDNKWIFGCRERVIKPALKRYKKTKPPIPDQQGLDARIQCLLHYPIADMPHEDDDPELRFCRLALWLDRLHHDGPGNASGPIELRRWLHANNQQDLFSEPLGLESDEAFVAALLDAIYQWSYAVSQNGVIAHRVKGWLCFKEAKTTDFQDLVRHRIESHQGYSGWRATKEDARRRDGFKLTDHRYNQRQVQHEVEHCLYCHDRDTDSCSKGMRNKKNKDYRHNPLGITLIGCPLEQKISEMHVVKKQGDNIAALALIMIDNPMCPGTGHRICNDCMTACIYQKKEPVNTPQVETNTLTDVLYMEWGFEIYGLLTRWNPLNVKRSYALPYNGKKVLVVGLGPAGYTLSHYLLNEGFAVTGIDALKLEPLPEALTGSQDKLPEPIQHFEDHYEALDERILTGFGGVAEYGITSRWDKNFLKLIYLNLLRRNGFRCFGGVRFGGTITIEDAWKLGFDHIAIATGAGKPTIIGLKNNLIRGIRKASDFLMALQLSGAAKRNSLANLQIRLPAGVIGGGLTAIDTTTEVMAYYPIQVEKILQRYEELCQVYTVDSVRKLYDQEELAILDEFIEHGLAIRAERQRAEQAGETANFQPLIEKWGGVTMFYRKGIKDSPAYLQNHEEVQEALQEGIELAEGMNPISAIQDQYGALKAVQFSRLHRLDVGKWVDKNDRVDIPLRSLFIAAGTSANTIYEQEHPYSFRMDERFFQRYEPNWKESDILDLVPMDDPAIPKIGRPAPFTSYQKNGRFISFYGDNHPVYAGSVVKAMASAKNGYPYITRLFAQQLSSLNPGEQDKREKELDAFYSSLAGQLYATVMEVNRLTQTIIEVIVKAPIQAKKFEPGQFYRVQNLESTAPVYKQTVLATEGMALTGAWVDKEQGLISLITLEMGSSSRLCALWKPGDRLVVMGVTGKPTHIGQGRTVMLVGGGLGNAVQLSIGKALRAAGNRVIYFAGYKNERDVFKHAEIEAASDVTVWSVDANAENRLIPSTRVQDKSCMGNIIESIVAYATGRLGETKIALQEVDHIIAIGSDRMMAAIKEARHKQLKPYLKGSHTAIGSINSPMQCMMKGVCAQCLCKHISPDTGEEYFVYSCYDQDQELDRVDFDHLNARLRQNSVAEKLSNLWLDYLFERYIKPKPGLHS